MGLAALIAVGAFVLVVAAADGVSRAIAEHDEIRRDLRDARDDLERRVEERTADLAVANEALEGRIHEVQAAETLLRRSEEYFRSLIENGTDLVAVLRPDGRIRYASPSVERVLGYEAEALRDTPFVEYVAGSDIPYILEMFNRVLRDPGGTLSLTVRLRHRDGSTRYLEATVQNLVDTPSVGGVVFSSRDVSDRIAVEVALQEQEAQLLQAQKMEAVGRLAGGVAHDFNNILTVIGGHAEYLRKNMPPENPLRTEAVRIGDAVGRAGRLTRQLLVFSRREVSRPRVLDLSDVVRDVNLLARRLLPETIDVRIETTARRWRIMADPGHIEQVILNLVVNARDAMADEGTVVIRTADEELPEATAERFGEIPAGRYVRLSVEDTGCGIAPEIVDRVFDPFFTTKGTGGTGLGLSTVFGIARGADAGIRLWTEVGRGTRVELLFPATEEEAVPPAAAAIPGDATAMGETLLLVEDEDGLRALTARGLRELGYVVLSAANADDAIRMVELYRDPIDLLVTDVVMPGLNGPALHRALEERVGRLPVLFTSGYPGEELSRRGLEKGRLLPKPYTGRRLAEEIRCVLDEG